MLRIDIKKYFRNNGADAFALEVAFSAADGITVLMGASGAGKTTILRLIAGILTPDAGSIVLNEQIFFDSDKNLNLPIQKRKIGFVFQDYALFPHLTARQNIAYGMKDKTAKTETARELLALFHIEHIADRTPNEMSGGEQQRVALARAMASNPDIVLLDEPLSAVDFETRTKLLDEIEDAQRRTKIPFIYVTHNEKEAERLESTRVIIADGRLVS